MLPLQAGLFIIELAAIDAVTARAIAYRRAW
jgi:hypothetical protein